MKHDFSLTTVVRRFSVLLPALALSIVQPSSARLVSAILNYDGTNPETLPTKLSQTGLYNSVASPARAVTDGIVAYELNNPLWSDGSHKDRFITIPAGTKVTPTDTDQYTFPDQTVLIKNFQIDSVYGDSATRIYVETRFLVIHQTDFGITYSGATYKWRRDQTDADLVDGAGLDTLHRVILHGKAQGKRWRYPSQGDCNTCHFNRGVLGFLTPQLNRPSKANPAINQLQALVTANILSANPLTGKPNPTFRWVGMAETGVTPPTGLTLNEWKARSYFASNCSHCHGNAHSRSFESASHNFDFFHPERKVAYATDSLGGFVGKPANADERFTQLIYPGYPESSYVVGRLLSRPQELQGGSNQMPPLATFQPDSVALNAIKDWICAMGTRGAARKLPFVQADSTYWDVDPNSDGLFHGGHAFRNAGRISAMLVGQRLTVSGTLTAQPVLSDMRGREIRMVKFGNGVYQIAEPLRPGVYVLRAGRTTLKIAYSR
jgi:hypothetical protein